MSQPNLEFSKKEKLYFLEGVFYDSADIDPALAKYNSNDRFLYIDFLLPDSIQNTYFRPNLLAVVINQVPILKLKEKKNELVRVKKTFTDNSKSHVLIMNDKQLNLKESKDVLSTLKARSIERIIGLNHAPLSIYGDSAKNGLIKIWTKN